MNPFLHTYVAFLVGMTPPSGALNPSVTQDNISTTICRHGWTATVRPSVTWTGRIKRESLPKDARLSDFELDHLIPLELGGAPASQANLWLQPWQGPCGAHEKDKLEDQLKRQVCREGKPLAQAQREILHFCKGVKTP